MGRDPRVGSSSGLPVIAIDFELLLAISYPNLRFIGLPVVVVVSKEQRYPPPSISAGRVVF